MLIPLTLVPGTFVPQAFQGDPGASGAFPTPPFTFAAGPMVPSTYLAGTLVPPGFLGSYRPTITLYRPAAPTGWRSTGHRPGPASSFSTGTRLAGEG